MTILWSIRRGTFSKECFSGELAALGFWDSQKLGRALGLILGKPRSSLFPEVSIYTSRFPLASDSTNSVSKTPGHNWAWKGEPRVGITW